MLKKRYFKTKPECEVTFEVQDEAAELAQVVCEINDWEPTDMKRLKAGPFRTRLRFPLDGKFEFRYLLDGNRWVNDEAADEYCRNEFGEENSVLVTTVP